MIAPGPGYARSGGALPTFVIHYQDRREVDRMVTAPWHSIKADVHHDNTSCNTGNNIERENRRSGTGGKPLCHECSKL
jgi:hypothetical protein